VSPPQAHKPAARQNTTVVRFFMFRFPVKQAELTKSQETDNRAFAVAKVKHSIPNESGPFNKDS
jgi:hypothetical protein